MSLGGLLNLGGEGGGGSSSAKAGVSNTPDALEALKSVFGGQGKAPASGPAPNAGTAATGDSWDPRTWRLQEVPPGTRPSEPAVLTGPPQQIMQPMHPMATPVMQALTAHLMPHTLNTSLIGRVLGFRQ